MIDNNIGEWMKINNPMLLERWDYELNLISPYDVKKTDKKFYWFKCIKNNHPSEQFHINKLHLGKAKNLECKLCKSFAQGIIDMYSLEYLNQIWSDENENSPWDIGFQSKKKFIFNCTINPMHKYVQSADNKAQGQKCPFCSGRSTSKDNSLGIIYPKSIEFWSDKNKLTPYDYTKQSSKSAWFKCENNKHDDYYRKIFVSANLDFKCPKCSIENLGGKFEDLTGMQFNSLTVIKRDYENTKIHNGDGYWICKCSCGKIKSIRAAYLKNGNTKTCGDNIHKTGSNNGNWKNGATSENLLIRTSQQYKEWAFKVYEKDWYTCQCCGKTGSNMIKHAHHIYNFSDNKDLRFDINNGITLCKQCHYSTEIGSFHNIYKTKNNTPEQLEEYINNRRKELGIIEHFTIEEYLQGKILKSV